MALYDRLMGIERPKIPVHQFNAALGEWGRGKWTRAQVMTAFGLSVPEGIELDTLFARVVDTPDCVSLGGYVVVTNVGATYDAIPLSKGLGMAYVDMTGVSKLEFRVFVSKIGTGTQSWQLWNVTDSSQVMVIDDAAAAAERVLSSSLIVSPPIVGLKLLRVRTKSTVAADDPVYYGATLAFTRAERLSPQETHEVLLLSEQKLPPFDTPALLKTRLGV